MMPNLATLGGVAAGLLILVLAGLAGLPSGKPGRRGYRLFEELDEAPHPDARRCPTCGRLPRRPRD